MTAAVGLRRTKLQLLHPSTGVRPTPLSWACAGAGPVTAATGRLRRAATRTPVNLFMGTPRMLDRGQRCSPIRLQVTNKTTTETFKGFNQLWITAPDRPA